MLLRVRADVLALEPKAVVILAGTNDIAGNTGPMTPEMTEDKFRSMIDLAKANGIRVIVASITPAADYPWYWFLQGAYVDLFSPGETNRANDFYIRAQTAATIPSLEESFASANYRITVLTGRAPGALTAELNAVRPVPRGPG